MATFDSSVGEAFSAMSQLESENDYMLVVPFCLPSSIINGINDAMVLKYNMFK